MLPKQLQQVHDFQLSFPEIQKLDFPFDMWDHGKYFESHLSFPQPLPNPKGVFCRGIQSQGLAVDDKKGGASEQKEVYPAFRKTYNKMIGTTAHL
jgi:hypothetical protein